MLTIQPLQWTDLPELGDVPDLDASDEACMEAIREVLARHGKLDRFAIHLVHRHFDLAEGEVLIERQDPDTRTQHVSVGRLADEPHARPTTWMLGRQSGETICVCRPGGDRECWQHAQGPLRPPPGPYPQPDRHRPDPPGPSWRPRMPRRDERER